MASILRGTAHRDVRNTNSMGQRKVERTTCPTVRLPDSFSHKNKRDRGDMGWDRDASTNPPSDTRDVAKKRRYDEKNREDKEEFLQVMRSIKDISATTFQGISKKNHKEEKLIALGAPKVKEQTMPLKMKMGILAGRRRREHRDANAAKESGQILASSGKKKVFKKSKEGDLGIDVHTKQGILHISRKVAKK